MEDVPFDWYFSEEDIKVYGGTKIHPKEQLFSFRAPHEVTTYLRSFQEARVRYVPTEIETLRGKGNLRQFSSLCKIYRIQPVVKVSAVFFMRVQIERFLRSPSSTTAFTNGEMMNGITKSDLSNTIYPSPSLALMSLIG